MFDRKAFLQIAGASAALASGKPALASQWTPPLTPVLLEHDYDVAAMLRVLDNPAVHKMLFLSNPSLLTAPGVAGVFQKMALSWTCYEFSLGKRRALSMASVLISDPVVFALNDAMWKKYEIAKTLNLRDRSGRIGNHNFSNRAWSSLDLSAGPNDTSGIYHDFSAQALLKRGASFLVCHNALAGVSERFAGVTGIPHADVLRDWTANTLPGFIVIPSGAMVVQLAQEAGWKLYPVTD